MFYGYHQRRSAPECQLSRIGDDRSFTALKSAIAQWTENELRALEEEMSFHDETGLVGIRMSRLSAMLNDLGRETAA